MAGTGLRPFWLAVPGALSQIVILAAEKGADVPGIAVVQTNARDNPDRGAARCCWR